MYQNAELNLFGETEFTIYLFIIKIVTEVQDRQRQKHNTLHRYKH